MKNTKEFRIGDIVTLKNPFYITDQTVGRVISLLGDDLVFINIPGTFFHHFWVFELRPATKEEKIKYTLRVMMG